MPSKLTLDPIYAVADAIDEQPFNSRLIPFQIRDGVAVEDIRSLFTPDAFRWAEGELGRHDVENLRRVEYAIVHRYGASHPSDDSTADMESERLVRNLAACLRLIRPMRQRTSVMRGELLSNGTIDVRHFDHPREILEVPEVQKLFHLRNSDLGLLRGISSEFLRAMAGQFWKFRMAVDFHEAGHFQDWYWKARYSLWCSALEALVTSQSREHQGSLVAEERIKWFLGENTSIYESGDIPDYLPQPNITVGAVVDDLYKVRNFIAHGDRVPDDFFERRLRQGLEGELNAIQVLIEALSFIVRKSILRILQQNLLPHFADPTSCEAYFGAAGLTNTEIRQRLRQQQP